ncbi:DUF2750 domain-containing protein [Cellulophaga lytica]|uniref:DUF2750 domain-containing protein n=1 Tax=Cellulophaga lytica (strain ATCC 23178 / DSM 7489 / JCM 8516 / NBRC 14961 / NCIMB 1423 / VKM B-1433 / Cy l20) TaxID=867900 RepID=F0RE38_CELLC|nr:DUF2750 domain-containing protein [Cellulophaga lytica]ADY28800.1 hypothetical protein Celly_0970 [Cellulophaga lytica DSM 7489]AIM59847.1 hypothetical protein IX49_04675 [Cellulophaga lytica]WQG77021.1 DUF2750 domain-containing protein [Cellulophaga lytica]
MSQSASQAAIFYRDVESSKKVWTIKDSGGFPAPKNRDGIRAMPFWSSKSRAEIIIKTVKAYKGFEPVELDLNTFYNYWLKILKSHKQLVGINWSGKKAVGYDIPPEHIINWIDKIRDTKNI